MTQQVVRKEITDRLKQWASSQTTPLKIAIEGVPFEKPNTPWLELIINPVTTVDSNVGVKRSTLLGFFQVNIYCKDGEGTKLSEDLAAAIIALYPVVPKVGTVSIEATGSILNSYQDAQWRVTPVRIRYRQENYL